MNQPAVLDIRNASKSFPGQNGTDPLVVLHAASFVLNHGESCAIAGPSGSGKTTLLGLCAGLDLPTTGQVILDGHNLTELDEEERARLRRDSVGFVFQSFRLIPSLTAIENVMAPLELRGARKARPTAAAWLDRVGLKERLGHYPGQLSGGEQQRVALARAFVTEPKILFADEPTGNLDNETGRTVIDLLFELNRTAETTLVLVTHDLELAARAGRLLRLKGGLLSSA